jgi:hypothetical protein
MRGCVVCVSTVRTRRWWRRSLEFTGTASAARSAAETAGNAVRRRNRNRERGGQGVQGVCGITLDLEVRSRTTEEVDVGRIWWIFAAGVGEETTTVAGIGSAPGSIEATGETRTTRRCQGGLILSRGDRGRAGDGEECGGAHDGSQWEGETWEERRAGWRRKDGKEEQTLGFGRDFMEGKGSRWERWCGGWRGRGGEDHGSSRYLRDEEDDTEGRRDSFPTKGYGPGGGLGRLLGPREREGKDWAAVGGKRERERPDGPERGLG